MHSTLHHGEAAAARGSLLEAEVAQRASAASAGEQTHLQHQFAGGITDVARKDNQRAAVAVGNLQPDKVHDAVVELLHNNCSLRHAAAQELCH